MGCGESKHMVATGNTIARSKSDTNGRKAKDIETVKETTVKANKMESVAQFRKTGSIRESERAEIGKGGDVKAGEKTVEKKGCAANGYGERGRLVSEESSNRFLSSRKVEDSDGCSFEGRSEKSVYFSPRNGSVKDDAMFNDNVKLALDMEAEAPDEQQKEAPGKDDSASMKKPTNEDAGMVKETATVETAEKGAMIEKVAPPSTTNE